LNLGHQVGDAPAAVTANRQTLQKALDGARPQFMQQVHGTHTAWLAPTSGAVQADACITSLTGLACTVMVADCLPVLFTTSQGDLVAAAHAGWRGLCQGVLESVLNEILTFRHSSTGYDAINNEANAVLAWLGPCIGPQAFEVGLEVRDAFLATGLGQQNAACFKPLGKGKYLADLPALARLRLHALGVTQLYGNDGSDAWCTVTESSRFFSHRRDSPRLGATGRMAACIWRLER
jgi:YfiH family protein